MNAQHTHRRTIPARRRAFSLTELMVVIGIIVLLVGLLLVALGTVRGKALEAKTLASLQGFSQACQSFQMDHGFYPGVIPESVLAQNPGTLTTAESALLHLTGGYRLLPPFAGDEVTAQYAAYAGANVVELTFGDSGQTWKLKIDRDLFGEGPVVDGKSFSPYFTPAEQEYGIAQGQFQSNLGGGVNLPDLLDAWGQPVIYVRRLRTIGPLVGLLGGSGGPPQFAAAGLEGYLQSTALGERSQDQTDLSVFNLQSGFGGGLPIREQVLKRLLEHAALPGEPRGEFMLLSAGDDGVYLSKRDGTGSIDDPITGTNIFGAEPRVSSTTLDAFDDVRVYGGG